MVPISTPSWPLIVIVESLSPKSETLVVASAETVTIVQRSSPVALTDEVVDIVTKPKALATVPVKVPPSIVNLPVESMNAVPPISLIFSINSPIVIPALTPTLAELKYKLYPLATEPVVPKATAICSKVVSFVAWIMVVYVISVPITLLKPVSSRTNPNASSTVVFSIYPPWISNTPSVRVAVTPSTALIAFIRVPNWVVPVIVIVLFAPSTFEMTTCSVLLTPNSLI